MLRNQFKFVTLTAALCATLGVTACSKTVYDVWRFESADRISAPADMLKRQVTAEPFMITVFEKVHKEDSVADIYFEGDGALSYLGEHVLSISTNPTPEYPLGLQLAAHDLADNVISISRQCQYSGMEGKRPGTPCKKDFWNNGRYSIETMNAMNTALDKIQKRYGFTGFNFVGVDGGAAVAVLLAAKRKDVLSLRTVAGILDTDEYEAQHKRAPLKGSLNPKDFAKDLAGLPQQHFIANWDKDMSPAVYQSYRNAMGPSSCIRFTLVDEVDHWKGWTNRWHSLMKEPLNCNAQ
ncbi:MAG: hypothetical protein JWO78_315 [Micavibrio sp.]|nr:hypothetical protein [Micavibrio sp.]